MLVTRLERGEGGATDRYQLEPWGKEVHSDPYQLLPVDEEGTIPENKIWLNLHHVKRYVYYCNNSF